MSKPQLNGVYVLFVMVFLTWIIVPIAQAQQEEEEAVTVNTGVRYNSPATIDDQNGEIQTTQSVFGVTYGYSLENKLPISLGMRVKHIEIDENLSNEYPSHLEARTLSFGTKFPLPFLDSDHHFMGIDVFPSLYTDDWKWESGAFRIPFRTYWIYKPQENFIFVMGVSIRPEYDNVVLPIIGFIYKPNDRLAFNLASENPNITYKLTDAFSAFAEFDYSWDEYEVTRNGQEGVVLKYKESLAGGGLKYTPAKFIEASISSGAILNRQLKYRDGSDKIEPDSSPYVKAKLELKF